jgi:mycothiol synthase
MSGVTTNLPAPERAHRPAELSDAEAIVEMVSAYNTAIVGFADVTLDDIRDDLVEPGFDRARDSWLVLEPSGRLTGYGWACANGDSDRIDIDVITADPEAAAWLLDRVCGRAREMGRERSHQKVVLDKGIYREDPMRSLLEARGFARATTFQRMRIDHAGVVAQPEVPPGLTIREATDDATRRAAHEVQTAAFADHFGWVAKSYAEWLDLHEAKSKFTWSQLWVADLDGRPVGICERTDQFIEDEDCGYVASIGVLPEARGRGIASYLLRRSFAEDAAAGRTGTILHVDANNTTPAVGLYESVGMRSVLIVDIWQTTLPVG